jgi:alpha-mannosidase
MHRFFRRTLAAFLVLAPIAQAQTSKAPDITKQPTLYVVPYAHLDTQWRWEFPQTINEYLLKTMRQNFYYIDKYPHYVMNWTGSNRYRLMKEYYPADYERMKQYVAKGRWYPAGASVEEGDLNLPSAEAIFRQVLYGNSYYKHEFGKSSTDFMVPDCFGFPASLPTILAHAGVLGFSTQKLNSNWQPAPHVGGPDSPEQTPEGIPFNVGIWNGPDGESVIAAFNPGTYDSHVRYDLSKTAPVLDAKRARSLDVVDWPSRLALDGKVSGVFADYRYVGTGDIGGATDEESVKLLEAMVTHSKVAIPSIDFAIGGEFGRRALGPVFDDGTPVTVGDGPVTVIEATSDQMFRDITPDMTKRMPTVTGDLELINHSAGSLTSEAYHKRWNRENELLADAAEKVSVTASWLGGVNYPQLQLNTAWNLVLGGQFHDTGAGTATPRAYEYAQNDDVIALNQFADVLSNGVESIASKLDTKVEGVPVVIYNSLNIERDDVVEAKLDFPNGTPSNIAVFSADGKQVPSQVEDGKVLFVAHAPSVGFAVYSVRPSTTSAPATELKATDKSIENARYIVKLNDGGDIVSVFDKSLNKELLAAPIRLALTTDAPKRWPAWNMDYDQDEAAPRAYVSGPAKIRISENGPVRVSLEVTRSTEGSTFAQTVSLSAGGAGERVEFRDAIDWKGKAANLKAVFPLAANNKNATYNWEVGTVVRPTAYENQFEVGSHHWIDLTDASNAWGATVLTGVKNGSDKPDDHTLRLTLLRTPGLSLDMKPAALAKAPYSDQLNQDWGHHEITYGLAGHAGPWQSAQTDWQAYRLNSPMFAFMTKPHEGPLGHSFSLVHIDNPAIRILALKKAEDSDATILRLVELHGKPAKKVAVTFAAPIDSATETNGQEELKGSATLSKGVLETSFAPYQPRTFALHLGKASASMLPAPSEPVILHYDLATASNNDTKTVGGFDAKGDALPAEMLPTDVTFDGIDFHLATAATGKPNAVVPHGQTITLPAGSFNRLYILAASAKGDEKAVFHVGKQATELNIQNWTGFIGQWDTRQWKPAPDTMLVGKVETPVRKNWDTSANPKWELDSRGTPYWAPRYPDDYLGLKPGFIKPATLAWYVSHYHTPEGLNVPYAYSYLFGYSIDLPKDARTITLPNNPNVRILAMTVAITTPDTTPVEPLYDTLATTK